MKTIIAAVNFSANSTHAAFYAADMAVAAGARLLVMHMLELPASLPEIPLPGYEVDQQLDEARQELDILRKRLLRHTADKIEVITNTQIGSMTYLLKITAEKEDAFAVVLGTDHADGFARLLIPNHTLDALQSLQCPLVVVPEEAYYRGIKKVVLAADLQQTSDEKCLQQLRTLLRAFRPQLDILHVHPNDFLKSKLVPGAVALGHELDEFHPYMHYIKDTHIEETVARYVKQNAPDLLIVIPKKHGLLSGLFHKSKSKALLLNAQIPVLSIHE